MHKALSAVLAAGITAPILATNGDIVNDAQAYMQRIGADMEMPSVNLNLSKADIEHFMNHPEELLALLQSAWNETTSYAGDFKGFDGFKTSSLPYANDPSYFSGYSSGEIYDLYEEAYPGYHAAMARQPSPSSSSGEGFGLGSLGGLGGGNFQNLGGLNMGNLGGGLGGLMNTYPGYTSRAEFNEIVFDE